MKKTLLLLMTAALFVSCSEANKESEEDQEKKPQKDTTASKDTVAQEKVEKKEEPFSYLEDYAALNTKEQLTKEFDASVLEDGTTWYAEGTVQKSHTVLTNPKNRHVVKYVWEDDGKTLGSIEYYYLKYDENYEVTGTQKIKTKCGVYAGMPLKELREWAGKDFKFSGFAWDFAGNIFPKDGKFKTCDVEFNLSLDRSKDIDDSKLTDYMGDVEISTADKGVMDVPIIVNQLTIYN